MDFQIKDLNKFSTYSNLTSVGQRIQKVYVYKYLSVKAAKACLENNTFRFKIPTEWPDPYESRFYGANYRLVTRERFDRQMYACCVTKNKLSESAWKMYNYDNSMEHVSKKDLSK